MPVFNALSRSGPWPTSDVVGLGSLETSLHSGDLTILIAFESPEQKQFTQAPTFLMYLHAFDLPYVFLSSPDENN